MMGIQVPYTSLHRFAQKWCDFGKKTSVTVRKLEGKPGEFAEVELGRLGYLRDLASRKPRLVYAFIMIFGYSLLPGVFPGFPAGPRIRQQRSGGRTTDYEDYPKERAPYAMG